MTNSFQSMTVSFDELLALRYRLDSFLHLPQMNQESLLIGAYRSKKRGRGIDFDQVRPYLIGDDVRNIDWKVTAKTGRAHTKLFYEEKERPIFILVDQSDPLLFSTTTQLKSTVCAKLGAMLAWWSYDQRDRIGGIIFNSEQLKRVPVRLSKKNVFYYLQSIVDLNHELVDSFESTEIRKIQDPLSTALQEAKNKIKSGSLIVLVCDERALSESSKSILKQLSLTNELLLFPVFDPLDRKLPKDKNLTFQQGDKMITLNGLDAKTQLLYQQKVDERLRLWHSLVKETKARYCAISTETEITTQLLSTLSERSISETQKNKK